VTVYLKAIFGALAAGLGSLYQALDGDNVVTYQEWVAIAIAVVGTAGVVWGVPNKDPDGTHQELSVQPPADSDRVLIRDIDVADIEHDGHVGD
jgi:hypothetical protein